MEKQGLENRVSRRQLLRWAGLGTAGVLLAACQPQIVEVEKEVTKIVEKVVKEVVKETIIVAGTPQVVEKEVTKIVKEVVKEVVTPTPAPPGKKHLTFSIGWGGEYGTMNQGFAKLYMDRNPNVKVEALVSQDVEALIVALAGGNPPDVFHTHCGWLLGVYMQRAIVLLDAFVDASDVINQDSYRQSDWFATSFEGRPYCIPYLDSQVAYGYIWNKQMFEDAGLDPEEPAKTTAEVVAYAKEINTLDKDGNVDKMGVNPNVLADYTWAPCLGIEVFDPVTHKLTQAQPELVEMYAKAYELSEDLGGFERLSAFSAANPSHRSFYDEREAMYMTWQWMVGETVSGAPEILPHLDVTWYPTDVGKTVSMSTGHALSIPVGAPDPEGGWHLIEFLCASHEVADSGWKQKGTNYPWIPWRKAMDWSKAQPMFMWFEWALEHADILSNPGRWTAACVGRARGAYLASTREAILLGQVTPEEGLRRSDEELQPIIDEALWRAGLAERDLTGL